MEINSRFPLPLSEMVEVQHSFVGNAFILWFWLTSDACHVQAEVSLKKILLSSQVRKLQQLLDIALDASDPSVAPAQRGFARCVRGRDRRLPLVWDAKHKVFDQYGAWAAASSSSSQQQ